MSFFLVKLKIRWLELETLNQEQWLLPQKKTPLKKISSKTASSRLSADVKEILNLFLVLCTSLQSNQNAIASLKKKQVCCSLPTKIKSRRWKLELHPWKKKIKVY